MIAPARCDVGSGPSPVCPTRPRALCGGDRRVALALLLWCRPRRGVTPGGQRAAEDAVAALVDVIERAEDTGGLCRAPRACCSGLCPVAVVVVLQ